MQPPPVAVVQQGAVGVQHYICIPQGDCISKQGQEPGEVGFVPTGSLELAPE